MATVFLTGASGFLGAHLLRELIERGHIVKALSRRPETDAPIAAAGGTPVRAALGDVASLQAAMQGCDAVFHAAADTSMWKRHAAQQTATNVQGTANMLAAAGAVGVKAFVHTSSTSAYSQLVEGVLTESVPQRGGRAGSTTKSPSTTAKSWSRNRACRGSCSTLRTSWARATATTGLASS